MLTLSGQLGGMQLRTLGTFELLSTGEDGHPVRVMGAQKPLAMLAYIALAPGARASRDQLAELLWQNLEAERSRRTLRQTLFSLRQKVGDIIVADGEYLSLSVPIDVDCRQFEKARDEGRLEEAWQSYTGHFIADFATSGSAPFEHWCDLQRERLRASWFSVGESLARTLLTSRPREAAEIAARLRDDDPSRADVWVTRIKALMLAGDRVAARAEALQFDAMARREGWRAGEEFNRVRAELLEEAAPSVSDPRVWRRPDLVGRETAFASLLSEWSGTVRGNAGAMVVVRGNPGIGKTMLLDEFSMRARSEDGQVIVVRARRVNADTPFALVAGIADRLAELPGALGVSPASASILVELSPALSAVFRSAAPRAYPETELLRLRTQALVELLTAVTDERALLLCIDDLHWADDPSRQILAKLGDVVNTRPLMLVLATRRSRRWVAPESARYVDLPPLSLEQVELLLTSIAEAEPALVHEIAGTLNATAGGVPLLVVSALELCVERQLLSIEQDQWRCPSIDAFRRTVGQGGVLEKLLAGVSPAALSVLTALAVSEGALSEQILGASVLPPEGAAVLDELMSRGLIVNGHAGIEIAHDELAEAALSIVSPEDRRVVMRRVGHALLADQRAALGTLALAGRLLSVADDWEASTAFHRWLEGSNTIGLWRDPMRAAADFLGAAAQPRQLTRLARAVPLHRRLVNGYPRASFVAGTMVLLTAVLFLFRGGRLLEPRAEHIRLAEPSATDGFLWSPKGPTHPIPVPFGAVFVDGKQLPTSRAPDSATIGFEPIRGRGRLVGTTTRPVVNGRVRFDDLSLTASAEGYFVVRASGLAPARSPLLTVLRSTEEQLFERMNIASGRINGQAIDSTRAIINVAPGQLLTGYIQLHSVTATSTAAIISGAVALWGDRRTNFITLLAIPPFGRVMHRAIPFADATGSRRQFRAPTVPGRYHIVLTFATETEFQYVASNTNWIMGRSVWNDGNDVADLTPREIEQLRATGLVARRMLIREPSQSYTKYEPRWTVGTVIDVVVQP